ncbi:MAG: prepilin-type N-terminal cleavage/methylation domain-containing protein [Campylobacteraceae bacterium]|jgi:prepilin-type N-terminal cleavage/methylation domain-containing protein|nr:prepilin-type N-terminal cleavage/methylation domain-containing protein [Campylobacteraceae bacterium]
MTKRAFSLIELVVSIVIIGIVSMSFPLILRQTSNNVAFAMQQEAILEAKTYIGTILSYPWDQNSLFIDNEAYKIIVLDVQGDNSLVVSGGLRPGHIVGDLRRKMAINNTTGNFITICNDNNCKDNPSIKQSMNKFNNSKENLTVVIEGNQKNMDSILSLTLTSTIDYVGDSPDYGSSYNDDNVTFTFGRTPIADSTNIKRVSVNANNATAGGPKVEVVLRAYSSNIGEFHLVEDKY